MNIPYDEPVTKAWEQEYHNEELCGRISDHPLLEHMVQNGASELTTQYISYVDGCWWCKDLQDINTRWKFQEGVVLRLVEIWFKNQYGFELPKNKTEDELLRYIRDTHILEFSRL